MDAVDSHVTEVEHWSYEVASPFRPPHEVATLYAEAAPTRPDISGEADEAAERSVEELEDLEALTGVHAPPGLELQPEWLLESTSVDSFGGDGGSVPAETEDEAFEVEEFARHADFAAIADLDWMVGDGAPSEAFSVEEELESWTGALERLPVQVRSALRDGYGAVAVRLLVTTGVRDENRLTNLVFHGRHPELAGRSIRRDERALAAEWLTIRDQLVRPLLRSHAGPAAAPGAPPTPPGARPRLFTSARVRQAWREDECRKDRMVTVRILGRETPANARTVEAWAALGRALERTSYRAEKAWVYNCRNIARSSSRSLHAYGLAVDIDPSWNPNIRTPDGRPVRFSGAPTQPERLADVRRGIADTVFTPQQVASVEAIQTVDGHKVFSWGGRWRTTKDTMHFQISVAPDELARGIRPEFAGEEAGGSEPQSDYHLLAEDEPETAEDEEVEFEDDLEMIAEQDEIDALEDEGHLLQAEDLASTHFFPDHGVQELEDDGALAALAERTIATGRLAAEGEAPRRRRRWTRCFTRPDIERVRGAYTENATAAGANSIDRCSCIVMLNVALGRLLQVKAKDWPARSTSTRRVRMAALTTKSIEKAMAQLYRHGFAREALRIEFMDHRGKHAGTLKPERLHGSVQGSVLKRAATIGCWYAFGLSVLDGYHSVLLLVDRTRDVPKIYWLDQFSTDVNDDVTGQLDTRITQKTQSYWQAAKDKTGKGYKTTVRLWALQKPVPQ